MDNSGHRIRPPIYGWAATLASRIWSTPRGMEALECPEVRGGIILGGGGLVSVWLWTKICSKICLFSVCAGLFWPSAQTFLGLCLPPVGRNKLGLPMIQRQQWNTPPLPGQCRGGAHFSILSKFAFLWLVFISAWKLFWYIHTFLRRFALGPVIWSFFNSFFWLFFA